MQTPVEMAVKATRFGPFRIVQPSHLRAAARCEMTQEQRLIRAKQDARCNEIANLLVRRAAIADDRRFSEQPYCLTGFGSNL